MNNKMFWDVLRIKKIVQEGRREGGKEGRKEAGRKQGSKEGFLNKTKGIPRFLSGFP